MQTDVKMKNMTATAAAALGASRVRIKSVYFVCGAGAGSISFRSGGAGGTELIKIDTPAGATIALNVTLPENGVLFDQDPYVTLTGATSVTFGYG